MRVIHQKLLHNEDANIIEGEDGEFTLLIFLGSKPWKHIADFSLYSHFYFVPYNKMSSQKVMHMGAALLLS